LASVEGTRGELRRLCALWRPALIVAVTAAVLIVRKYHGGNWWRTGLRWVCGERFAQGCVKVGLNDAVVLYVAVPVIVLLMMRERLRDYGLGLGKIKRGLAFCGLCYALYIPCYALLLSSDAFRAYYAHGLSQPASWFEFLWRQSVAMLPFMMATEFLFRGFLMFGLARPFGRFAGLWGHLLPYVMAHWGKPEIETWGSFPVGLALGLAAMYTGSIWYGVLLHWTIAVLLNVGVVLAQ